MSAWPRALGAPPPGFEAAWPRPARIAEAARTLPRPFRDSPQFEHDALNAELGARTTVKVETLNPLGSFKGRGAETLLARLDATEPGLVCASAGNFGAAVAFTARRRGVALTVFAAETATPAKVARMRDLGARVRLAGRDLDGAKAAAREHAEATGATFVEDGFVAAITEGAGTIAVELGREEAPFDAVVVPFGNGALANGVGTWAKAEGWATRVVAVAAEGAPAMAHSWRAGEVVTTSSADTRADGIAVRRPVPAAVALASRTVDEVLLVSDDALADAAGLAFRTLGVTVEPAGVAGLAALLAEPERFRGARVATPLCGNTLPPSGPRPWD